MHGSARSGFFVVTPRGLLNRRHLRRWLVGHGFLTFHVSLFLSGGLALLLGNLATSPSDLWADTVIWRWAMLLLIHGLAVALLLLIDLLRGSDVRPAPADDAAHQAHPAALPARIRPEVFASWPSPSPTAEPEPEPPSTAPVDTPSTAPAWAGRASPGSPNGDTTSEPSSTGVRDRPATEPASAADRVSWEEAGVGAWLTRRSRDGDGTPSTPPDKNDRNGRIGRP